MKINITVEELTKILKEVFGIATPTVRIKEPIENTKQIMPEQDSTEEIKTLSDSEVHQAIVEMCLLGKVSIYINYVRVYTTCKADYDNIAELLYPYDGEIVSIYSLGKDTDKRTKYFINTL